MVQGKELRRDRNADLEPDTPNGSDQEEGGWRNSIREGLHQRRNDPVQTSDAVSYTHLQDHGEMTKRRT